MKCNARNRINNMVVPQEKRDKAILLKANGEVRIVKSYKGKFSEIRELINCQLVQFVAATTINEIKGLEFIELCIDDEGFFNNPVVNKKASLLFGTQFGAQQMVGDILVESYDIEEGRCLPLTDEEVAKILYLLGKMDTNLISDKVNIPWPVFRAI